MTAQLLDMRRRKVETTDEVINEIPRQFEQAHAFDNRALSSRIYAGKLLLLLHKRVEAGEVGEEFRNRWFDWYATKFVRSRKDAEAAMRLARDENAEGAYEEEKASAGEQMRAVHQEKSEQDQSENGADVRAEPSDISLVVQALRLVAEMNSTERLEFFALLRAYAP
jgi:hypothetical protein